MSAGPYVLHLCVMTEANKKPERVGIRQLRQNLSVYVNACVSRGGHTR